LAVAGALEKVGARDDQLDVLREPFAALAQQVGGLLGRARVDQETRLLLVRQGE
jgi:hypothetical protein